MKMKELERRSGVGRETIRFYIREGLLPKPKQPFPNVASYSEEHVERLKAIRSLLEDPNMTLGLIRRLLAGEPTPVSERIDAFPKFARILESKLHPKSKEQVALANLTAKYPDAPKYAEAFEKTHVLKLHRRNGQRFLNPDDAKILEEWVATRSRGFKEEYGFGPDGIDPYVEATSSIAAQVAEYFLERVSGQMSEEEMASAAAVGTECMSVILPLLFKRALLREFKKRAGAVRKFPANSRNGPRKNTKAEMRQTESRGSRMTSRRPSQRPRPSTKAGSS